MSSNLDFKHQLLDFPLEMIDTESITNTNNSPNPIDDLETEILSYTDNNIDTPLHKHTGTLDEYTFPTQIELGPENSTDTTYLPQ